MDQTTIRKNFFANLNRLPTGQRVALKRSAGTMLFQADAKALAAFYRALPPGVPQNQEPQWFAAACFACLWDPAEGVGKPMEQLLAEQIRSDVLSESTQHRVEVLMDMDWNPDGYFLTKLSRIVKMLKQKATEPINATALLEDLLNWNNENQKVQRKWASAIFSPKE